MATDRNILKQWFIRGAKPLATQFGAWIDAFWHKDDKIPASNIEGLQEAMDEKANQQVLQAVADDLAAHKTDTTTHADIRDAINAEASARASEDEGLHDDIEAEEARAEQAEAALVPKDKLTAVLTGAAFSSDATSVELTFNVYNAWLDTSSTSVLTVPLVSGDNPGMMPPESYEALTQALADILALQQQGGKYIGQSFATKAALNAYVFAGGDNPGDFTFVLDDETQNDATTRYIISGTKTPADTRTWSFGYVINYDPTGLATAAAAGLVKGTAATDGNEGKVFVETNGTMSVIGWDSIVTAVGTLSGLTTTAKNSLVAAINELKTTLNTKANETSSFTEATTRENIASSESVSTIFGKIKKFFSDLKPIAFSGSYSDLLIIEYYVTDLKDGKKYPVVKMPDGKWILAVNYDYRGNGKGYNNNDAYRDAWGSLYNLHEIIDNCPTGWRFPSSSDFSSYNQYSKVQLASKRNVNEHGELSATNAVWTDIIGTDAFGFNALPAGIMNGGGWGGIGMNFWQIVSGSNDGNITYWMLRDEYDFPTSGSIGGSSNTWSSCYSPVRYIIENEALIMSNASTPAIPAAQVNSDWNATSGVAQVLNKPAALPGIINQRDGSILKVWAGTEGQLPANRSADTLYFVVEGEEQQQISTT